MLMMNLLMVVLALIVTPESFAYKPSKGNVAGVIGPAVFKTNYGGAKPKFESTPRGGLGLTALGDVSDKGSLEISAFTINKIFLRDDGGKYLAQRAEMVHITMGYRRWFSERFSGSISFFSAYAMGTPKAVYSEFVPGTEIDTSARDKTEYGFDFALQVEPFSINRFALAIDTRYSLCVTPKEREHADHYGIMVGLRYLIQSK